MTKFNERLKILRKEANLSQEELAKKIGVSKSSVNMYERGEREPGFETLEAIADCFNADMDFLLGKSDCKNRYEWAKCKAVQIPTATNIIPMPDMNDMSMNEKIRYLRKLNGLTLEEVGNAVGVGKSTVRKWENGDIENMRRDKIASLAAALHTTPAYLMGWEEDESTATSSPNAVKIPVLGRVAAGLPITAVENVLDYEEIPSSLAATGDFVALQIKGQSMEPRIYEGDIVIVRVQPTAETGDLAVVIVNGDEATVKKIKFLPEGILLQPFNPAYQPFFYSKHDIEYKPVRIFGKVVELRAKF